jgi:hypothetical protein
MTWLCMKSLEFFLLIIYFVIKYFKIWFIANFLQENNTQNRIWSSLWQGYSKKYSKEIYFVFLQALFYFLRILECYTEFQKKLEENGKSKNDAQYRADLLLLARPSGGNNPWAPALLRARGSVATGGEQRDQVRRRLRQGVATTRSHDMEGTVGAHRGGRSSARKAGAAMAVKVDGGRWLWWVATATVRSCNTRGPQGVRRGWQW